MHNMEHFERSASLEAESSPDLLSRERTPSRRRMLIASMASVLLIASQNPVAEAELGSASAEMVGDEAIEHTEAREQANQQEIQQHRQQQEFDQQRRDPLQNTQEVVILPDVPGVVDYEANFVEAGEEFDVNPNILAAIAWLESRGDPNVSTSTAGARGYMQIMPKTADDIQQKTDFGPYTHTSIKDSIRMAAATWATNRDHYMPILLDGSDTASDLDVLLASYNWGIGGAEQYVNAGCSFDRLPGETKEYFREFHRILADTPADVDTEFCLDGEPISER